ncbi:MAG: BON domain-containing protein [Bryobacteraceae bacterium]
MLALSAVIAAGSAVYAADDTPAKADNTKNNRKEQVTADQQKMNAGDRELSKKVRKAIMADKTLSTYAHNVKVIARDGMVTLKGPVRSDEEKGAVEARAVEAAGAGKVTNELTIAPKKTS